jgi:pyruvate/2-oxoglutarate dehydrogenase complex dihydrolipoamide acyltransferase (E2) component
MPQAGETMKEGKVVEWLKKEGDVVRKGEIIVAVETDKATIEVESDYSGILKKIIVFPEDGPVPCLSPIGIIGGKSEQINVEKLLSNEKEDSGCRKSR